MDSEKAIAAIKEAKPPATDRFTYLTIVESNLSPAVLPTLNEVLQDAELTQEIGWDLVYNLANLPGSDECLETIARLGNPREVILKVLETLELLSQDDGYESDDESEAGETNGEKSVPFKQKFITLVNMLSILHKRIKTKYPSRFLATSLQTIYNTYRPNHEMTAAVINLVRSLAGNKRPPLPSRKSSVNVANPDQHGDATKNAPDPEADKETEGPTESAIQERLLLSFATCILESFVNKNDVAWAPRLLEFHNPEKIVPGRKTLMARFRDEKELSEKDGAVGQLVALIADLGLSSCGKNFLSQVSEGPLHTDPLSKTEDISKPEDIGLSTGGCVILLAYWVFSTTVFDSDHPVPDMHMFPNHLAMLDKFLQGDAEDQIQKAPGTVQALVTIGLWLHDNGLISAIPKASLVNQTSSPDGPTSDYMSYILFVTLVAVFHPQLHVRNAASCLAGQVLHADPADDDRLKILYDLLENCDYASLKACAVTWLREELIAAGPSAQAAPQNLAAPNNQTPLPSSTLQPGSATPGTRSRAGTNMNVFAGPQALETVQYVVFPNMDSLKEQDVQELVNYLGTNAPFILQAANFGLFLWSSADKWRRVLPLNLDATVKERWLAPLKDAVAKVKTAVDSGEVEGQELGSLQFDLDVLGERLSRLEAAEGFAVAK
ncbi:YAP-binding/ALF4/Glomulin [Pseudoneurospora amorphoporcata]|uniref:YAP-binding/ALF4/Glomulin n=1 Tax=Pseudoneurospora amorphoporcata TaxID=241081 RepID=A0AAN6SI70_9PEZI|nr:YAP-binding/ALF4/Glomulin [Pseudoneurospora amorphoporcata]